MIFDLNEDDIKTLNEYGVDTKWLEQLELDTKKKLPENFEHLIALGLVKEAVQLGVSHFLDGDTFKTFLKSVIDRWVKENEKKKQKV